MTHEEFAALLNSREYMQEITDEESDLARQLDLLVVFGYSDDCVEFRGVIDDECGVYKFGIDGVGRAARIIPLEIDYQEVELLEKFNVLKAVKDKQSNCITIEPFHTSDGWIFHTNASAYSTFTVMEEGQVFGKGLVIDMKARG